MNAGTILALLSWLLLASIAVTAIWCVFFGITSALSVMPWICVGLVGLLAAIGWAVRLPTRWDMEDEA